MADQLLAGLPPVLDFNGDVVAGGSVTFYETNTTTPVAIWSDIAATIPLANPLTLDSAGRPSNQIFYVGTVAVKEVIKDAGGATLYTVDPSPRFSVTAAAASGVTYAPIASNPSLNVQDAIDFVSLSSSVFPSIVGKAGKAPYVNGGATAVEYIDSLGYLCTATGADTIVLATGLDLNTLTTGVIVGWIQATTNTGAATVEVDNVVAAPLVLDAGGAVAAGELTIGKYYSASYDGTNWVLIASGTGGIEYTRKTANYTLSRGEGVIADTTGGTFTVTLPATPATGDSVVISDGGDWSVTNLTVGRNGSTIEGDAADMTMDVGGVSVTFIYDATTWQIYTTAASDTGQYATAAQGALADTAVQPSDSPSSYSTYGGTANAITLTTGFSLASVPTGIELRFRATVANTGATTINVDGLGVATAWTATGAALPADYIRADVDTVARYNGTQWVCSREVERGSNVNGDYTRWEDGTQICTTAQSYTVAVTTAAGGGFRSTAPSTAYTLPASFVFVPICHPPAIWNAGVINMQAGSGSLATTTTFAGWHLNSDISAISRPWILYMSAIGRWY